MPSSPPQFSPSPEASFHGRPRLLRYEQAASSGCELARRAAAPACARVCCRATQVARSAPQPPSRQNAHERRVAPSTAAAHGAQSQVEFHLPFCRSRFQLRARKLPFSRHASCRLSVAPERSLVRPPLCLAACYARFKIRLSAAFFRGYVVSGTDTPARRAPTGIARRQFQP